MYSKKVTILNKTGLHARPASEFISMASKFKSRITIKKVGGDEEDEANAKSIISVLSLGASFGSEITIIADGPDAEEAVAGLVELLDNLEE